jgi:hypothetical protein
MYQQNLAPKKRTNLLPTRIRIDFVYYPVAQRRSKEIHEGGTWCNSIRIPSLLVPVLICYFFAHCYRLFSESHRSQLLQNEAHLPTKPQTPFVLPPYPWLLALNETASTVADSF